MVKTLIFDWGDTIMRDYQLDGPMSVWEKVAWIPGAEEALQTLQQKYTCIIATSAAHSDTAEMIKALSRVGANTYFSMFFSQKELGTSKPDPRFFRRVLELSGAQAAESAMIGNIYEKDIVGAKQIGMTTVLFNEQEDKGDFPDADYVITAMTDLLKIF